MEMRALTASSAIVSARVGEENRTSDVIRDQNCDDKTSAPEIFQGCEKPQCRK